MPLPDRIAERVAEVQARKARLREARAALDERRRFGVARRNRRKLDRIRGRTTTGEAGTP